MRYSHVYGYSIKGVGCGEPVFKRLLLLWSTKNQKSAITLLRARCFRIQKSFPRITVDEDRYVHCTYNNMALLTITANSLKGTRLWKKNFVRYRHFICFWFLCLSTAKCWDRAFRGSQPLWSEKATMRRAQGRICRLQWKGSRCY